MGEADHANSLGCARASVVCTEKSFGRAGNTWQKEQAFRVFLICFKNRIGWCRRLIMPCEEVDLIF